MENKIVQACPSNQAQQKKVVDRKKFTFPRSTSML